MPSASHFVALTILFVALGNPLQDRARTVLQVNRSHSGAVASQSSSMVAPAAILLASARTFYITSADTSFETAKLEAQIIGLKKFHRLGLSLTRDATKADAIVEVTASDTGTTLTYTVIDARTQSIIGGGKESAIFGLAPKMVAKDLVDKIEKARKRM